MAYVRRLIAKHHAKAAAKGLRLVPCCGFDSAPFDLGALLVGAGVPGQGLGCCNWPCRACQHIENAHSTQQYGQQLGAAASPHKGSCLTRMPSQLSVSQRWRITCGSGTAGAPPASCLPCWTLKGECRGAPPPGGQQELAAWHAAHAGEMRHGWGLLPCTNRLVQSSRCLPGVSNDQPFMPSQTLRMPAAA